MLNTYPLNNLQVSKILLHTSGRALAGGVTVVFGSITMAYDIYKLSTEVESIASKGAGNDIREIAEQLEKSLDELLSQSTRSLESLECSLSEKSISTSNPEEELCNNY